MHWERAPLRELIVLSWPITLSTLSFSLMTLVDTLVLGRVGRAELAGVGLGGVACFALLCFPFGLLRGVKTLVSQAVGADRRDEIGRYLAAAVAFAVGVGLVTTLLGETLAGLISHIAPTEASAAATRTYMRIRILGAPISMLYVALREVRYAQGDARSPMRATMLANAVNIVLAMTFVLHFHWGVAGAAVATVIAQTVEMGTLALAQGFKTWDARGTTARHLKELWKIGAPTGVQFSLEMGAFNLLTGMVSSMGEMQGAAHQIAIQVIHVSFLPAFAVAEAASVLVGQAVGAARDELVTPLARRAMLITGAYTGLCTLILATCAPLISGAFHQDAITTHVAVTLLWVAAVFQVFDAANIVARAVLRGTGDVRFAAAIGVTTSWVFTPPLTWLLGYRLHLGALGGWLGLLGEIVAAALILWWRTERHGWKGAADESRARIAAARAAGEPEVELAA